MNQHEQKFAYELADTLGDRKSLAAYEGFVKKYKEQFLRNILEKVMATPERQIRKTRGALFTFLVKQYERFGNDTRD